MKQTLTKIFLFKLGFFLVFAFFVQNLKAQEIKSPNFYSIQGSFNEKWDKVDYRIKDNIRGKGWKTFRRWEYMMEPRVYPSGNFIQYGALWEEALKFQRLSTSADMAKWTPLGPVNVPSELGSPTEFGGNGRVDVIEFHPNDSNIIWVGTPSGGAWKSTDHGNTWVPMTNNLPTMAIADVALHPTNNNVIYLATGDRDSYAGTQQFGGYSVGVLKSTDGGTTWNLTGLNYKSYNQLMVSDLLIDNQNPDTILAATNLGIYRTTDAGATWSQIIGGYNVKDIKFKPGDNRIIYGATLSAGGNSAILRSVDGGLSFNPMLNLPITGVGRYELAVSPANPNVVVALAANFEDDSFAGLIKSSDNGVTWAVITAASPQNLFGWNTNGSDAGGQGSYDITVAISPENENDIHVGGVNVWRTLDGGVTWNAMSNWYTMTGYDYVHADQHYMQYSPLDGQLYVGNDGGIYRTKNGIEFTDISNTLTVLQIYRIGVAQATPGMVLTGNQDNGTYKLGANGDWNSILGGDGMECAVDPTNSAIIYGELYYGDIRKSTCGGCSFKSISPTGGKAAWIAPYVIHPVSNQTMYLGGQGGVFISDDQGESWRKSNVGVATENLQSIATSADNASMIYTATFSRIWRSSDKGDAWTEITAGLPKLAITYIAVSHKNPLHVWVTLSGYEAGEKVYMSTDGGANWKNYSEGLPNVPLTSIIYQKNSNDVLYLSSDIGVFYREAGMPKWLSYNKGLPGGMIYEVDIQYSENKLYAGSYGRGTWVTPLYKKSTADVGVASVLNPLSGYDHTANELVTVQIYNFGTEAQSNIGVSMEFNGDVVSGVYTGTIAPGDTAEYTFAQKLNIELPGKYALKCFTILANDLDPSNDAFEAEVWNHVTNQNAETGEYAINMLSLGESINCGKDASLNLSGAFTIEAWINPASWGEAPNGYGRIVDKDKFLLYINDAYSEYGNHSLVFSYNNGSDVNIRMVTPSYSIKLGEWQHVAVSGNGTSKPEIYINGVKQTTVVFGTAFAGIASSSATDLYIGESVNQTRAFVGMLDEVRIWNVSRTETELNNALCSNVSGNTGLVGYWRFNDGPGATYAKDLSGNNNHGIFSKIDPYDNWMSEMHTCFTSDLEIVELVSPVSGQNLSNAENVTVKIKNNGNAAQSNFTIRYILNNGNEISELYTGSLAAGAEMNHTFSSKADMSAFDGYNLKLSIFAGGDQNPANDMLDKMLFNTQLCFSGNNTSNSSMYIHSVSFSDFNSGNAFEGYFRSSEIASVHLNKMYTFSTIVVGYKAGVAGKIWIDWNNDKVFKDSEIIRVSFNSSGVGTAKFMGDASLAKSLVNMRFMLTDTTLASNLNACSAISVGETEDYLLQLLDPLDDASDIASFTVDGQVGETQIDAASNKITVILPRGTDLKKVVPVFTLSTSAKAYVNNILQVSGVSTNNFTDTVVYKVYAEDATHFTNWKVKVRWVPNSQTKLLTFSIVNQVQSLIDTIALTVNVIVPDDANMAGLIARFTLSEGAFAKVNDVQQVSGVTTNNFSQPVVYKVYSENLANTRDWTVKVSKVSGINTLPDTELSVFPNPAVSYLRVNAKQPVAVTILTADGKILYASSTELTEHEVDLNSFANGTYVVKVLQGNLQNTRIINVVR